MMLRYWKQIGKRGIPESVKAAAGPAINYFIDRDILKNELKLTIEGIKGRCKQTFAILESRFLRIPSKSPSPRQCSVNAAKGWKPRAMAAKAQLRFSGMLNQSGGQPDEILNHGPYSSACYLRFHGGIRLLERDLTNSS